MPSSRLTHHTCIHQNHQSSPAIRHNVLPWKHISPRSHKQTLIGDTWSPPLWSLTSSRLNKRKYNSKWIQRASSPNEILDWTLITCTCHMTRMNSLIPNSWTVHMGEAMISVPQLLNQLRQEYGKLKEFHEYNIMTINGHTKLYIFWKKRWSAFQWAYPHNALLHLWHLGSVSCHHTSGGCLYSDHSYTGTLLTVDTHLEGNLIAAYTFCGHLICPCKWSGALTVQECPRVIWNQLRIKWMVVCRVKIIFLECSHSIHLFVQRSSI